MNEINHIIKKAEYNAKIESIIHKFYVSIENDISQLEVKKLDDETLEIWHEDALKYELYNMAKTLKDEQNLRKNK